MNEMRGNGHFNEEPLFDIAAGQRAIADVAKHDRVHRTLIPLDELPERGAVTTAARVDQRGIGLGTCLHVVL